MNSLGSHCNLAVISCVADGQTEAQGTELKLGSSLAGSMGLMLKASVSLKEEKAKTLLCILEGRKCSLLAELSDACACVHSPS